MYITKKIKQQI